MVPRITLAELIHSTYPRFLYLGLHKNSLQHVWWGGVRWGGTKEQRTRTQNKEQEPRATTMNHNNPDFLLINFVRNFEKKHWKMRHEFRLPAIKNNADRSPKHQSSHRQSKASRSVRTNINSHVFQNLVLLLWSINWKP